MGQLPGQETSKATVPLGYRPALDGIRAIAILLVVAYHCFGFPPGGTVGVDVFFVLSGFLITTLLLEEHAETGRVNFVRFLGRRARRLLPALFAMLVVYLAVNAAVGDYRRFIPAIVGGTYVANIVDAFYPSQLLVNAHLNQLWSLAQEEQFYLVWPALLLVAARTRRLAAIIAVAAVALALYRAALMVGGASPNRIYYGPDTHSDGLLIGAALAAFRIRYGLRVKEWAGQVGVCALLPAAFFGWGATWWAIGGEPLFEVATALLIAAAVSSTAIATGLGTRPLVWLGRRSYSLYLWHVPVLGAAYWLIGVGAAGRMTAFTVSILAAAASFAFVEQPLRHRRAKSQVPLPVTPLSRTA